MPKNKKLALNSGMQTIPIKTNDEVCIPSLSSILLAVIKNLPRSLKKIDEQQN